MRQLDELRVVVVRVSRVLRSPRGSRHGVSTMVMAADSDRGAADVGARRAPAKTPDNIEPVYAYREADEQAFRSCVDVHRCTSGGAARGR
jgi:hypothetical protein